MIDDIVFSLQDAQTTLEGLGFRAAAASVGDAVTFIAAQRERESEEADQTAHNVTRGYAPSITQTDAP